MSALIHWLGDHDLAFSWGGLALQLVALGCNIVMLRRWATHLKTHAKTLADWRRKLLQASKLFRAHTEAFAAQVEQLAEREAVLVAKCHALGVVMEAEKLELPHDFKPPTRH